MLVTGMSGAGKSSVLDALEDMGWECVDNLPMPLLGDFVVEARRTRRPIAVGMDVRSRGFDPARAAAALGEVPDTEPEILFLDCSGAELTRRYDNTRRRHPLANDRPAEDGIARERSLTAPLREAADSVLDTTDLSRAELRDELRRRFGSDAEPPVLTLVSFGFSKG
ncbi:MAG: RNase adaptor protein RapZ, partial [Sphingomonas sp.]|nr:RNase adaptor protein RapZ [Sphingomonas sp.]